MTERYAGYVVTLAENIRADDARNTIAALIQIKGVVAVTPVIGDYAVAVAQQRERLRLTILIHDALETFDK